MEKYSKNNDTSYALGTTLTIEMLKRKKSVAKRVYINPKQKRDETFDKLVSLAREAKIPVILNNEKIFTALSGKDNVMAIGEFMKFESKLDEKKNHLVLVNPSNMGNLGTILRSGAAFEIGGIAIIKPAADCFDPKCVRSSMGAIFSLPFRYYSSFEEYEKEFPNHHLYPFMLQAKTELRAAKKQEPYSLVFGNEATGLPAEYLKKGDPLIIAQSSEIDSLNLDNAVSIGLYHFKNN